MNSQQGRTCGTYQTPKKPSQTTGRPNQTPARSNLATVKPNPAPAKPSPTSRKPNPTPGRSNNQDKVIHRNNNQERDRHPHGDKPLVSRDLGAGSGGSQALVRAQPQNGSQPPAQQPQQWTLGGIHQGDQFGFPLLPSQTQTISDGRIINLFNNCTLNIFQTSEGNNLRSAPPTRPISQNDRTVPKIGQQSQQGKDELETGQLVHNSPVQHPRDYIRTHAEEMEAWNNSNWKEVRACREIDTIA